MRHRHAIISLVSLAAILAGLSGCPLGDKITVTVIPPSAVVEAGLTVELSAQSSSPDDTDFAWESSDESVAVVETVKSAAVVLRAVAPGTATITATANVSGATGPATVSVLEKPGEGEGEGEGEIPAEKLAPGLNITISTVTIPEDGKPVVEFVAEDDKGNTIGLSELTTLRFALAYLNNAQSPQYVNYVVNSSGQAGYDGAQLGGTTQNDDGSFTYKFKSAIPADYSPAATHQLGGQVQRLYVIDGLAYTANPVFTFRPDGQPVTVTREISATQVCNNCHTRLGAHGGSRREFQLCILCHTAQTVDPDSGNSVDMVVMAHKIHMGKDLPSGSYEIIGHGGEAIDFSDVAFPQDIRNCTTCHQGAPQAGNYLTKPGQTACGSCHDTTWFGDPEATPDGYHNHPLDFDQPDDSACVTCHKPTGGVAGILESHATETSQGPGLALDITDITAEDAEEGMVTLTADFTAVNGAGEPITDLAGAGVSAGMILAWPAPEYQDSISESVVGSERLVSHGGGAYSYTFEDPLPLDSTSYAIAMQGRVTFTLGEASVRQGTSSNGFRVFTLDGSAPTPRRDVVANENCNTCHGEIRGHGGQRFGVEVCLMCHRVNQTDLVSRDDSGPDVMKVDTVTVNFKDMIHRIHTGEELNRPYSVAGHGGNATDFREVLFPGDRRQCTICHIEERPDETATFAVPLPEVAAPTVIDNETTVTEILPARAACNSCHDHLLSDIHAVLMTDTEQGVETCAVCHGEGSDTAVTTVHRLNP
ncbi:MAG: OmcA/MtrC family decaheme c-type cytochrome [Candidatus Hydrogenedentes bacterium]|nr:OmcA/MtrC family decaheme c-type cytochrome [Candidatus Hydrogenedentota bacterium]